MWTYEGNFIVKALKRETFNKMVVEMNPDDPTVTINVRADMLMKSITDALDQVSAMCCVDALSTLRNAHTSSLPRSVVVISGRQHLTCRRRLRH